MTFLPMEKRPFLENFDLGSTDIPPSRRKELILLQGGRQSEKLIFLFLIFSLIFCIRTSGDGGWGVLLGVIELPAYMASFTPVIAIRESDERSPL